MPRSTSTARTGSIGFAAMLLIALAGAADSISATERIKTPHVDASLISDVTTVAPTRAFSVGLKLVLAPGWHTYWQNPGDSGLATRIVWTLPNDLVAGDIEWPIPDLFRVGDLVNYGYTNEVVLVTRITPKPGASLGDPVRIEAQANWLVCADICVPEEGHFTLELPRSDEEAKPDLDGHESIARAVSEVPMPGASGARFEASPDQLRLTVPLERAQQPTQAWFFPYEYGIVDHAAPQVTQLTANEAELVLIRGDLRSEPLDRLRGVLVLGYADGSEQGIVIDAIAR